MNKEKSEGRARLEKLASFLYRVPRDKFNMNRWIRVLNREPGILSLNPLECNTQGCAIGWATVLFAEEGFDLTLNYTGVRIPSWGLHENWKAVQEFFELPMSVAEALFASYGWTANLGPRQVAKKIRGFLKTGKV